MDENEVKIENEDSKEIETDETPVCGAVADGELPTVESDSYDVREAFEKQRARAYNRTPLALSLIGLLTTFLFGAGLPVSVIALVMSSVRYSKRPTRPLKWAIAISVTATVFAALYIAGLVYVLNLPKPSVPIE